MVVVWINIALSEDPSLLVILNNLNSPIITSSRYWSSLKLYSLLVVYINKRFPKYYFCLRDSNWGINNNITSNNLRFPVGCWIHYNFSSSLIDISASVDRITAKIELPVVRTVRSEIFIRFPPYYCIPVATTFVLRT